MAKKETFRKGAEREIARLLEHWRQIERGIKRAEQISGKAVIPAINELRYASRQLINGQAQLHNKTVHSAGEKSVISKRLIIAEQYLLNADHDVIDGSVTFFRRNIIRLNQEFGKGEIATHYNKYPDICDLVDQCESLIEETRTDYSKRKANYDAIRTNHLETLVKAHKKFESAEVDALYARAQLERTIKIKEGTLTALNVIGTLGAIASIIAIPLTLYLALSDWGALANWNFDLRWFRNDLARPYQY